VDSKKFFSFCCGKSLSLTLALNDVE